MDIKKYYRLSIHYFYLTILVILLSLFFIVYHFSPIKQSNFVPVLSFCSSFQKVNNSCHTTNNTESQYINLTYFHKSYNHSNISNSFDIFQVCQPWLIRYLDFHKQYRDQGPYLISYCDHYCGGFGDRIRGTLWLLRVAAAFNRVLLIFWKSPHVNLFEQIFSPKIDWRTKNLEKQLTQNSIYLNYIDIWSYTTAMRNNRIIWDRNHNLFSETFKNYPVVKIQTNIFPYYTFLFNKKLQFSKNINPMNDDPACLMNLLFSPQPNMLDITKKIRKKLFGGENIPYMSVHVRIGGPNVTWSDPPRYSIESGLQMIQCALNIRSLVNFVDNAPLLLITDSDDFRVLAQKQFPLSQYHLYVTNTPLYHTDRSKTNVDNHLNTFIDFYLLSQSTCILTGFSGFGIYAAYWGNIKCHYDIENCEKGDFGSIKY